MLRECRLDGDENHYLYDSVNNEIALLPADYLLLRSDRCGRIEIVGAMDLNCTSNKLNWIPRGNLTIAVKMETR